MDPAESPRSGPVLVLVIVYLIGLCVTLVVSFRRISMAGLPQVYREARAQGVPASAKVLEIKRTRWRNPRTRNLRLQPRPLRLSMRCGCEYREKAPRITRLRWPNI